MRASNKAPMFLVLFLALDISQAKNIPGIAYNQTLTIGYLISWSHEFAVGPYIGSAMVLGLDEIERRQLLPGYKFDWIIEDTWCQKRQGIKAATEVWLRAHDLDVIIGPSCSIVCQPVGLLAAAWGIPALSNSCQSDVLSDKLNYPTFARTVGPFIEVAHILYHLSQVFNWNRIGIVTDSADLYLNMAQQLDIMLKASGKETRLYIAESTTSGNNQELRLQKVRHVLRLLKLSCRIIFVTMFTVDVRNLLAMAYEEDMLKGYVYAGPDFEPPLDMYSDFRPDLGLELYEGVIDSEIYAPVGPAWDNFRQDVIDSLQSPIFDGWDRVGPNASINEVSNWAGMLYDATLLWAYGVNKTLEQGYAPDDGFKILNNMINLTFEGITGSVSIDSQGDRMIDYTIQMVQNGTMVTMLHYIAKQHSSQKVYKPDNPHDWSGLLWPGNVNKVPEDSPECGWNNELCDARSTKKTSSIIAGAGTSVAILGFIVICAIICLRKNRFEKELQEAAACVIPWSEVHEVLTSNFGRSVISVLSTTSPEGDNPKHLHCNVARYKTDIVVLNRLGSGVINLTDKNVLLDLKTMKQIEHENLNSFIGICVETHHACIFMLYASHGSLQDVIADSLLVFTSDFKLSLSMDVAQGMKAIHLSNLGFHGHLTSANCVVDSRWVCKITDYGLRHVRKISTPGGSDEQPAVGSLLWTAPELLDSHGYFHGTRKGDVYSYGIILQELILQSSPYYENGDLTATDIVERVRARSSPPYRPVIVDGFCSSEWLDLMTSCWDDSPDARPTFSRILSTLTRINGGAESTLVDSMIKRLEAHSVNLEEIVAQRSTELVHEKDKLEHLLTELLPKLIIKNLKLGRTIEPESFDKVTIFFSDIVSFTRISAAGTPMDVVKMLNLMYTVFDDIATDFDVYKVATIGDAYFVASGVPNRNGNKHATEISNMAIKLLEAVSNVPVPHLPDEVLRLRIGIHTGPCLAGVVGVKMPRYLLFGDTVDIASQMESKGDAMRIHVSSYTEEILPKDEYKLQKRDDLIMVKGHVNMITYWLQHYKD